MVQLGCKSLGGWVTVHTHGTGRIPNSVYTVGVLTDSLSELVVCASAWPWDRGRAPHYRIRYFLCVVVWRLCQIYNSRALVYRRAALGVPRRSGPEPRLSGVVKTSMHPCMHWTFERIMFALWCSVLMSTWGISQGMCMYVWRHLHRVLLFGLGLRDFSYFEQSFFRFAIIVAQ